jgi:glyoxylase-like metal-dependent hydrolase (beta-lactamase superfamily II)
VKTRLLAILLAALALPALAQAPAADPAAKPAAPQRPPFETRQVEGTDNVYIFRYGNHQSMFVVTGAGVIATDPIAYGRPQAAVTYIEEIRKVTDKPIKYLIYSHHHFDHIMGGQPFKDAGAKIIAHKQAKARLAAVKDPNTPLPDEVFDKKRVIRLGGTTLELFYLGRNHSDSTIVMRLPKEKLIFLVDTIPVGTFPGLGMIDFYPLEAMAFYKSVLAMDWERMIPGHPGQPGGRLGTKKDVEDHMALQQHVSDVVKEQARAGKCWNPAEAEVQFEQYKDMPGYANGRPITVRRYCALWGRGT